MSINKSLLRYFSFPFLILPILPYLPFAVLFVLIMRGAFLLAALAFACVFADGVQLDIHLVPSNSVMRATVGLAALAPHNQINFTSSSDPHITLYLTSFVEVCLCCFCVFLYPSFFCLFSFSLFSSLCFSSVGGNVAEPEL